MAAVDFLLDLVSIPSVSSMSNRPVIDYVCRHLNPDIWIAEVQPYDDKVNLVARTGAGVAELALVCHTDTVPFDPAWTEATHPVVRDGHLYGRGSCDVKGFLACILEAITGMTKPERPLALILTADEEIGCIGARRIAASNAIQARYMIIGEPTGLHPAYAGKGYGLAEIVVHGQEAHSAFPGKGRSAIRDAARILNRLDAVAADLATRTDPDFDPPYTTLNVGLIQGGTAKNIVPGECRMTLEWRPIPGDHALDLIRRELSNFPAELIVKRLDAPFEPGPKRSLEQRIAALTNRPSTTLSFGTEAGHLGNLADQVVVFGAGDMTTAHKTGERVPLAELDECAGVLRTLISEICLQSPSP
jgi:acetylornithine deacetylase